jgi:nitrite reductase/ring-hydroxylating ferredoxin subunit
MTRYLFSLLLPLILFSSCSGSDDPEVDLFTLSVQANDETESLKIAPHSCEVVLKGWLSTLTVTISGDFDGLYISDNTPDWIDVSASAATITLSINSYNLDATRSVVVSFTVKKGNESNSGSITITQNALAKQDYYDREELAIKSFLSQYQTIDHLPNINAISVGENAPFYKIDDDASVYMQVIRLCSGTSTSTGDKISFRFERTSLLNLYEGKVVTPSGNISDLDSDTSFYLGDYSVWGSAIQLPLELGLPLGSEINLIVPSLCGIVSEQLNIEPYLYHLVYYNSTDSSDSESPAFLVNLSFDEIRWAMYGVPAYSIKIFDKIAQIPADFPYSKSDVTGVVGIAIVNGDTYISAYDVACPIERDANVKLSFDDYGIATCPQCGSKFTLLNGEAAAPIAGVAYEKLIGMHKYKVTVNRNYSGIIQNVFISK